MTMGRGAAKALAAVCVLFAAGPGIAADLPPVGRSLFDDLFANAAGDGPSHDVPFPFEKLVQRVEALSGLFGPRDLARPRVLIPRGRSLQRHAARGRPDKFPRAVVAFDGDPGAPGNDAPFVRDRLFLGYQETARILEVISFNDAAGRFEYQVVRDYGPDTTPRVSYANRRLCLGCHQGGGPIWSAAPWDESNANAEVAAAIATSRGLAKSGRLYGIPIAVSTDAPLFISNAVERANAIDWANRAWRHACGTVPPAAVRCRGDLLRLMFRTRLNTLGTRDTSLDMGAATLTNLVERNWPARWPEGISRDEPIIANRVADGTTVGLSPALDPLVPRPAREPWAAATPGLANRILDVLGDMFAAADLTALDAALAARRSSVSPRQRRRLTCRVEGRDMAGWAYRVLFQCREPAGEAPLNAIGRFFIKDGAISGGYVDRVETDDRLLAIDLGITEATRRGAGDGQGATFRLRHRHSGRRARLLDGRALEQALLDWSWPATARNTASMIDLRATLILDIVDDLQPLDAAIDSMVAATVSGLGQALGDGPLRRRVIMNHLLGHLNGKRPPASKPEPTAMVTTSPHDAPSNDVSPLVTLLRRHCAGCHAGPDEFPPNFLYGDHARIERLVNICRPRMARRLAMAHLAPEDRIRSPMPPQSALAARGLSTGTWRDHVDFKKLVELLEVPNVASNDDALPVCKG